MHHSQDVDPDDLPGFRLKSERAKDERRRLMVAILCQEFQLGGLFCKKRYFEPPSQFALKMPKQLYDEEPPSHEAPGSIMDSTFYESAVKAFETTELDGVVSRYKVGQIWQLIGISFRCACDYLALFSTLHDGITFADGVLAAE